MVLSHHIVSHISLDDNTFDTDSIRCGRTGLWISLLLVAILLLFLLFNIPTSDARKIESAMGLGEVGRSVTMDLNTWTLDLEHESLRCRCKQ